MRPYMLFYLWIAAPVIFFTAMLYGVIKRRTDTSKNAMHKRGEHH